MTRRFAVAVALGAAALAFAADDPNAPLANTKQQLQSLKKDEAAQKAGTQGGAKLDLPTLNTPGQELDLPAPKREETDSKNSNRAGQKNWLLDGYDELGGKKTPANAKRGEGRASARDVETPLNPNDPNYFLRVYERQRDERDAKRLQLNASENSAAVKSDAVATDPFAPFMKDWLANSPVRDALQDTLGRDAPGDLPPPPGTPGSSPVLANAGAFATETPRTPTANPFVQALGLPALETPKPAEARSPVADLQSSLPVTAAPAPTNTIYDLPERPKVDLKQALPPPPSEDKKYFPQLKKF